MTRETASAAETAAGPTNGRIPFAFRIGVVGHRKLVDPAGLIPAIHDAISRLTECHDAISGLAECLLGIAGTRPSLGHLRARRRCRPPGGQGGAG